MNPRKSCLRNVDRFRGRSGDKLDLRIMAMGLGKSPVASDKRYAEALGEGDVGSIGHGMSGPKLVGTLVNGFNGQRRTGRLRKLTTTTSPS